MRTHRNGSTSRRHTTPALAVCAALVAAACTGGDAGQGSTTSSATATTNTSGTAISTSGTTSNDARGALGVRLSHGTANVLNPESTINLVPGDPLDPAAVDAVISRLPAWLDDPATEVPFSWPTQRLTPPRVGATIDVPFPPTPATNDQPDIAPGPLEVVRYQPTDNVSIAPYISVTFNQPMVKVGTVAQVNSSTVPVTIQPNITGTWQWIGTRTLRFDASSNDVDRLPMATTFTATVPAGTTSTSGAALAADVTWTFSTPPVDVVDVQPLNDTLSLTPVFVVSFDQRIDPEAVLSTTTVTADNRRVVMRLATADEVDRDDAARSAVAALAEGRWLAITPTAPLPGDAPISITVGPGTPSAEGPRPTTEPQAFAGRTYAPLKITDVACDFGGACYPGASITVTFNNSLDPGSLPATGVNVNPSIAGGSASIIDNTLQLRGNTTASTEYTVTVPGAITDVHGQQLGADSARSVRFGSADPEIRGVRPLVTLDPLSPTKSVSVYTINHQQLRLTVYRAAPDDWAAFESLVINQSFEPDPGSLGLEVLTDSTIDVDSQPDTWTETPIQLDQWLYGAPGHLVVFVRPAEDFQTTEATQWMNRPIITWAQSTDIGLDALNDDRRMVAWTTSLADGAPLDGVTVTGAGTTATTDAQGLAELPSNARMGHLVATKGTDTAILAAFYYPNSLATRADQLNWFAMSDRGVYRPGETAKIKGWVRRLMLTADAQLQLLDQQDVAYELLDSFGNQIAKGSVAMSGLGGFDLTIDIPDTTNLGQAYLRLSLPDSAALCCESGVSIDIQEFRRPEFEAVARTESPGPYVSTQPATLAVDANYYAGGPLAAAPVTWQVSTNNATYAPPNWQSYTFGEWTPWWWQNDVAAFEDFGGCCFSEPVAVETFAGTTDSNGTHYLQIDFEAVDGALPDTPVTITANAAVTDVNRQTWGSSTSLLVHPGDFYVGLRTDRTFVTPGDGIDVDVVVTDIDGNVVAGRSVTVTAARQEWQYTNGQWAEVPTDTESCTVTSGAVADSDDNTTTCSFATPIGGSYLISSTLIDDRGGRSRSQLTRWVSGGEALPSRTLEQGQLLVVPDRQEYRDGDVAQVMVQAPFASGEGLVAIVRNGIRETQRFTLDNSTAVIHVPINERDVPQLDLAIEVVGSASRVGADGQPLSGAPPQPAYATATMTLSVPPVNRTLDITATPRDAEVVPGGTTAIDLTVLDTAGAPMPGAEVAVVVVDEAVLAQSGYTLGSPIDSMYTPMWSYVETQFGRGTVVLAATDTPDSASPTEDTAAAAETTAGGSVEDAAGGGALAPSVAPGERVAADGAKSATPIDVRANFNALALFAPTVITNAAGQATVQLSLPDSLTRYRVMVVATANATHFGTAEANITARLPLMIRPSAPRFANFGDQFELPVIVQNQTANAIDADIVIQTSNLRVDGVADGRAGRRVSVPANSRVEVRFPVETVNAGTAAYRVAVTGGEFADAASGSLPVYTPSTTEAFATYGVVDEGAIAQPIVAPTDVIAPFGGLEVTTASTNLQALTDAFIYINEYDYQSADAAASQIMTISTLRPVLDAFGASGLPSADTLDATMATAVDRLVTLQNDDGGWASWQRGRPSDPFISVHAVHALLLARQAGFAVPDSNLANGLSYLTDIEARYPTDYPAQVRTSVSAYAVHVRNLAGDRDPAKAERLFADAATEPLLDALAWLWPVVDDPSIDAEIERIFGNRVVETAGAANFTTSYGDDAYVFMYSDRRTDGIVLDALISQRPTSDLIPKVVTGLLGNQTKGRWHNLQENTFILLALASYFDEFESVSPDFVARVWLGEQFAGEHIFAGRTIDRAQISVPTQALIDAGDSTIIVDKDGEGRLYYRIGLRYAPSDLTVDAIDRGFVVDRVYEAVDNPDDVRLDAEGVWHIKAGARVRVRLTMVAESQRTHVALVDPLPAGLEILNPSLAVTEALPTDPTDPSQPVPFDSWWYSTWYEHQNMGDDRAEAFASVIGAGTYSYSYIARATTPGTFVVPPTRAEEIYAPETFGHTSSTRVIIF